MQEVQLKREPLPLPKLIINPDIKSLEDLEEGQKALKSEIRTVQKRLFNPDDGLIVEVHKNTEFKQENQENLKDVNNLISWKGNVTKALWVVYSAIIGVIIKLLFWD